LITGIVVLFDPRYLMGTSSRSDHLVGRPVVDDLVRLTRDVPELGLTRGQIGAVKSVWCEPLAAFEIEFRSECHSVPTRALLLGDAISVVEVVLGSRSEEGFTERRAP
jgi:Domain of unknown function (DUF4926)